MKRIIIIFLTALLLTACVSKKHENINQDMADDTNQILTIYDVSIKEDRLFTEKELLIIDKYALSYGAKSKVENSSLSLTEEENMLYLMTKNLFDFFPDGVLTESEKVNYEKTKEHVRKVIKDGALYN